MAFMYTFRKWVVWLSVTGYLLFTVLGIYAWRSGILKYACMQQTTPSMTAHLNFLFHPLTGTFVEIVSLILGLNFVAMIADLIFGPTFWNTIYGHLQTARPHLWAPLFAVALWLTIQIHQFSLSPFLPSLGFYLVLITLCLNLGRYRKD